MEGSLYILNNEKRAYYANSAIGVVCGFSAYKYLPRFVKKPYANFYLKKCNNIPVSEHKQYWDSAKKAFQNSKYFDNNLQITDINKKNWEAIANDIIKKCDEFIDNPRYNQVIRFIRRKLAVSHAELKNRIEMVAQGKNASYFPIAHQVIINSEKRGIAAFHEIGHSINEKSKGFRKVLANSRVLSVFAVPVILCAGLLTPKREKGDEYQNPIGKTATYIKEHCGTLAALSMLPIIIEEGVASINGAELAKKVLDKKMYKKLNKMNTIAFGSYVLGAATIGLCAALAVHIKDLISVTAPVKNKN